MAYGVKVSVLEIKMMVNQIAVNGNYWELLGLGLSVITLNLGMYLGVPAVVIVGIRKRI
jgi:hypothetical protein